jgi:hypothetical protein
MKSFKYKRPWNAQDKIRRALKDGNLISWYKSGNSIVVNLKSTKNQ